MARSNRTSKAPVRTQVGVRMQAGESAPDRWLANIRLSGFTVTMLVVVILAVIVLAPQLKIFVEQQEQIAQLSTTVKAQQSAISAQRADVARWSDPAYIEAQARNRLLVAKVGEIPYLVTNAGAAAKTPTAGQPVSANIQTTEVDWTQRMLGSLLSSGLTDATADTLDTVGGTK